ncbi:MAG: calcium/sodium antiporter [Methylococcales bacterium]|jgi:cation:H+ antiporter|nr:calcium/sodium antiporter [Methylococcales bacterium]MBT7409056.1 calcium/sodium antiporter [Methylococcales bacterium]
MVEYIAAIVVGIALLVWGADRFVVGASSLAKNFGVSPLLIGLTIVGFGTSLPEMLVSATAAFQGNSNLAIGNAIGSNITNIALIIGLTALIAPISIHSKILFREFPILVAACLLTLLLLLDGSLSRFDGIILFSCIILLMLWMVRVDRQSEGDDTIQSEFETELPESMSMLAAFIWFLLGLCILIISSKLIVWGAVALAKDFGVSDLVIGLTIIALGTSLPELAASVMSVMKNEHDLAIGNIIGSNLYNMLAVLSMPGIIDPGVFSELVLQRDFPIMLILTFVLWAMCYGTKNNGIVNRFEGALLLLAYGTYQALIYFQTTGV